MEFRHEEKYEINFSDMLTVRQRLRCVAYPDPHAVNGVYRIRSLYFDSASDKALREKLDGVNRREKFRIRCYNGDSSVIHLEKKSKLSGLGNHEPENIRVIMTKKIHIKKNAWIGARVNILPGVTIGENAIIGTGSIVTKDIPDNAVAVGNPARVVKMIEKK